VKIHSSSLLKWANSESKDKSSCRHRKEIKQNRDVLHCSELQCKGTEYMEISKRQKQNVRIQQ